MQAYIAISYSKKRLLDPAIQTIVRTLEKAGITAFVFANNYHFQEGQDREMMDQAFADIDKSAILIAETSDKAIGIGVEVGYAKAKNKPVIYLRQESAPHSSTVSGASDYQVVYSGYDDLEDQLALILSCL